MDVDEGAGSDRVPPRVRQGIKFVAHDDSNGELRITGDDDAGLLLWGAQWLDELLWGAQWLDDQRAAVQYPAVPRGDHGDCGHRARTHRDFPARAPGCEAAARGVVARVPPMPVQQFTERPGSARG
jgi:hypothetical protein